MGKFKMVVESREKCTGGGFPEVNYSTQLYLYKTKWNIIMKGESYAFFCTLLPENQQNLLVRAEKLIVLFSTTLVGMVIRLFYTLKSQGGVNILSINVSLVVFTLTPSNHTCVQFQILQSMLLLARLYLMLPIK